MYPRFFCEIVALDKQRDAALSVAPVTDFGFARDETVLPALVDELPALACAYPVVFTNHDTPVMVALAGRTRNNSIDEKGALVGEQYLPLVIRTYPFAALEDANGELVFCIDRKYPGIVGKGGKKIFADKKGNFTAFGMNAATFANTYVTSLKKTREFTKKLKSLDLLMPAEVTVTKDGESHTFSGLSQIDMQKLSLIPVDELRGMIDSQEMYYIYLHQLSLNNFSKIA